MAHSEQDMATLCNYVEGSNIDVDVAEKDLELSRTTRPLDLMQNGLDRCQRCWCWTKKEELKHGKCLDCR